LSVTDIFNLALSNLTGVESDVTSDKDFFATVSPRDVLFFCIGIVIAYVLGLIISHHVRMRMSHRLKKDQLDILTGFIRVILIIIAVGISLPGLLDLSVTIILICIAGVIAIIALSSQKVISNMVAGIALLYESPFATGDYISTGGVEGTVVAVRLFSVQIRTGEGVYVHIPNDQIYSTAVSNVHANVARRFEYRVGIRYEDDINRAIAIIRQLLEENPYVLENPASAIYVSDISADSVVLSIRAWFPSNWQLTKDDISRTTSILPNVKDALEAAGIEMPYAQRVIWFANEPSLAGDPVSKKGQK